MPGFNQSLIIARALLLFCALFLFSAMGVPITMLPGPLQLARSSQKAST